MALKQIVLVFLVLGSYSGVKCQLTRVERGMQYNAVAKNYVLKLLSYISEGGLSTTSAKLELQRLKEEVVSLKESVEELTDAVTLLLRQHAVHVDTVSKNTTDSDEELALIQEALRTLEREHLEQMQTVEERVNSTFKEIVAVKN